MYEQFTNIDSSEAFVDAIQRRNIEGITPLRAMNFASLLLSNNAPPNLLGRIAESLDYVSHNQFEEDLHFFSQELIQMIGNKPYVAALHKMGSNTWIMDNLIEQGLPKPKRSYSFENLSLASNVPDKYSEIAPLELIAEEQNEGTLVLVPDDMSLTGVQMYDTLSSLHTLGNYEVLPAVLYGTNGSRLMLKRFGQTYTYRDVASYIDCFSRNDIAFLRELTIYYNGHEYGDLVREFNTVPFWTWFTVPDNIDATYANLEVAPLVNRDSIKPPYIRMNV